MMTKKKHKIFLFIGIILLCLIIFLFFLFLHTNQSNVSKTQEQKTAGLQQFPPNSPEEVTQTYYTWYADCLKQHPQDLHDAKNLTKDCPLLGKAEIANNFTSNNQVHYTDQVLCDDGIPKKMVIGKAYIEKDHTASINVTTTYNGQQFAIPVRLRNEEGSWKIFRIDCDLDGSLE